MGLTEAEELELLELEEQEYQASASAKEPPGRPGQGGSMIAEIADPVLRGLDYAGGLVRTGVAQGAEAVSGKDIVRDGDWERALKGEAPGSSEFMKNAGVPEGARVDLNPLMDGDTSVRDIGGFALDVATDPLTYTGVGAIASIGKKPVKAVLKKTKSAVIDGAKVAGDTAGSTFTRTAEALTAAPSKSIEVYSKRTEKLNELFKKYDSDIAEFSDDIKNKFNSEIQKTKSMLNKNIDEALDTMPDAKAIDVDGIKGELIKERQKLNAVLDEDAVSDINEYLDKIDKLGVDGKISVKDLNSLKQYFQGQAKGAYRKEGQMFTRSKRGQLAAKAGARLARKQLNQISPEIAKANNSLSRLHSLEDSMNKNIIKEGGSYNALKTAGSGANKRNRKHLKELSEITGKNFVEDAENIAAFDTFAKPSLLPMDTTGKSVARTGAAYILGGLPAAVMTSPMTLKIAINAKKVPKSVVRFFGGGGSGSIDATKIYKNMTSPEGKKMLETIGRAARIASVHSRHGNAKIVGGDRSGKNSYVADLKGENKWAFDGYLNLLRIDSSGDLRKEKMMKNIFSHPSGRKLLISASSVKGDNSLNKILSKVKKLKEAN